MALIYTLIHRHTVSNNLGKVTHPFLTAENWTLFTTWGHKLINSNFFNLFLQTTAHKISLLSWLPWGQKHSNWKLDFHRCFQFCHDFLILKKCFKTKPDFPSEFFWSCFVLLQSSIFNITVGCEYFCLRAVRREETRGWTAASFTQHQTFSLRNRNSFFLNTFVVFLYIVSGKAESLIFTD